MKRLRDLCPGFFFPIVPKTHVLGIVNPILHDTFPEEVCEQTPIYRGICVSLEKCLVVWLSDEDKIAFFALLNS